MTVRVTLEFEKIDEAIVALGKLVGGQPSKAADSAAPIKPVAGPSATKPRKPRNDAGKPRGPYTVNAEAVVQPPTGEATAQAGIASSAPASGAGVTDAGKTADKAVTPMSTVPVEVPAAASAPKTADAQAAIAKLFDAQGLQGAMFVLSRYGVKAVRELKPEQYAPFIADVEKALAGGVV